MDDVLYSWKRFQHAAATAAMVANAANPQAPVLSVAAPDPRTMVISSWSHWSTPRPYYVTVPTSTSCRRKPKTQRPGPAQRPLSAGGRSRWDSDYRASTSLNFKRHQEYWDKERPYIDGIEYAIIPEYAQTIAQFRAGNVHTVLLVRQEDVVGVKKRRAGPPTCTRAT